MLIGLEHGLDISSHRSRHLSRDLVGNADVIFGMSRAHVERARKLGGDGRSFLLGEYAGQKRSRAEVDDPYGAELDVYRDTYQHLKSLLDIAVGRLIQENDDANRGD